MRSRPAPLMPMAAALLLTTTLLPATGSQAATSQDEPIVLTGDSYRFVIDPEGFRYAITRPSGELVAPAHATSGLVVDGSPAVATELVDSDGTSAVLDVTTEDGGEVTVEVVAHERSVELDVEALTGGRATIDFRTGPVAPAYGLGDYGAHANGQPDEGTPCGGNVEARHTTELTGVVFDNLTNQGSCKRFITNFTIFPAQSLGQVLFDEGTKRVGITESENRLGVADAERIDSLVYFVGSDLHEVYSDYRDSREEHGYLDVEPQQRLFELGWESYGALTWNTHQRPVEETVREFLDHGYQLRWGVIGSGFWPGPRGNPSEGSTTSFGMWDDVCDYDPADGAYPELPCPRYPDPDRLKELFDVNDMALILGLRNNMKAPDQNPGWNTRYDGPFAQYALEQGYFLEDEDGSPLTVTRAQYPSGPQYVLDARNPEALDWFVEQTRAWEADGFKEDAMIYAPVLGHDGIWNPLLRALHEEGDHVIVRNAAYSVPGDVLRANDTYYGRGEDYNHDPDRLPVNMLNFAASAAPNVYGDYVGGTPTAGGMNDASYQDYFVRNAWLLAVSPSMSFGRGPWEMDDPAIEGDQGERYAASVLDAAEFHERLVPYIYDAALDSHRTGYPHTMTPLPIAYPDDPRTYHLANAETRQYEWMVGENLLAAPVFGADFETAETRDVYLPRGSWIDYSTGARFEGPTTLEDYPLGRDRAPVFVGGSGVIVERDENGLQARVFPVGERGDSYTMSTQDGDVGVDLTNVGWDPQRLRVIDTSGGGRVSFEVDATTGALAFDVVPGHSYRLVGGSARVEDTIDREAAAPEAPTRLAHAVDGQGLATLSWAGVEDARSYLVQRQTVDMCGETETVYVGSTTGETSLPLGPVQDAPGEYRIVAWSSGGASPASEPHSITLDEEPVAEPVVVTNEGSPVTCDPDQPAYSESGSWRTSSLSGVDGTSTRYSSTGSATWRADLPPGDYQVEVWYPSYPANNTDAATYEISDVANGDQGGSASVTLDQRVDGGTWVDLGTYTFVESELYPRVQARSTGEGFLRADAVRFTAVE